MANEENEMAGMDVKGAVLLDSISPVATPISASNFIPTLWLGIPDR